MFARMVLEGPVPAFAVLPAAVFLGDVIDRTVFFRQLERSDVEFGLQRQHPVAGGLAVLRDDDLQPAGSR
jgi:hypothetical protein